MHHGVSPVWHRTSVHHQPGGRRTLGRGARPRDVGEGEELAPEPGTVGELIHFDGSATRIDGGGRCVLIQVVGFDGNPSIVVRLHAGRSWHRAVPSADGQSRYELRISEAVVTAHDAIFAAIRRPGGSCVLVVVSGRVEVTSAAVPGGLPVNALEAVALSSRGQVGRVRQLSPDDVAGDAWLEVNRMFDGDSPGPSSAVESPAVDSPPPPPSEPPAPPPRVSEAAPGGASRAGGEPGAPAVVPVPAPGATGTDPTAVAVAEPVPAPVPAERAAEERTPWSQSPVAAAGRRLRERLDRRRVGLLLVMVVAGGSLAVAYRQPSTMLLTVNGRQVRLPRTGSTVAAALEAADVPLRDGALYSAGTRRLLDRHFTPATLLVNGLPVSPGTRVRPGARIETTPGRDAVEATAQRQAPALPPPLPSVEHALWYPGVPGKEDQVYGVVSGEVLSRKPIVEPVPPRRELGNVVALTFDDGPHPLWTPQVLEILRSEGVKATFCVVGSVGEKHPDLVRAERDAGHAMCNHTKNHAEDLDRADPAKVAEEVEGGFHFLKTTLGAPPPLYRPPGGDVGATVIEVAQRNGMRVLRWTVDPRDHEKAPADVILARTLEAAGPGAVILLHDGGGDRAQTVAMLRPLIQQLKSRGFSFATPLAPPAPPG